MWWTPSAGTVVASHRLTEVKHCLQVHVTSDERRFYVAFSGIFAETRRTFEPTVKGTNLVILS